jgi:putative ABC transport system ATP-binding protein
MYVTVNKSNICMAQQLSKLIDGPNGSLQILHQLDVALQPGEALAILGASGSGKSTLLSLLAGLDVPTSGRIWLCGTRIDQLDENERATVRAGRVSFVFQNFQLLSTLTAFENVVLPLELIGGRRQSLRDKATKALAAVGLTDRAQHYPTQLSGGEQQRLALARAFATQPQILFADEPTGNLDSATGAQIIDLLLEPCRRTNMTLVLVTHDPMLANRCDRRLLLCDGVCKRLD